MADYIPSDPPDELSPEEDARLVTYLMSQEMAREGRWGNLRDQGEDSIAWPGGDNPMLMHLFDDAVREFKKGHDGRQVLFRFLVATWFEGHIEGYDHGQRDARADVQPDSE